MNPQKLNIILIFCNLLLDIFRVWYVQDDLSSNPEQVIFDPNILTVNKTGYLADLDTFSFDGQLMAYGLKSKGSAFTTVRIRNVSSGEDIADILEVSTRMILKQVWWTKDNLGLFYTVRKILSVYKMTVFKHTALTDVANISDWYPNLCIIAS